MNPFENLVGKKVGGAETTQDGRSLFFDVEEGVVKVRLWYAVEARIGGSASARVVAAAPAGEVTGVGAHIGELEWFASPGGYRTCRRVVEYSWVTQSGEVGTVEVVVQATPPTHAMPDVFLLSRRTVP